MPPTKTVKCRLQASRRNFRATQPGGRWLEQPEPGVVVWMGIRQPHLHHHPRRLPGRPCAADRGLAARMTAGGRPRYALPALCSRGRCR